MVLEGTMCTLLLICRPGRQKYASRRLYKEIAANIFCGTLLVDSLPIFSWRLLCASPLYRSCGYLRYLCGLHHVLMFSLFWKHLNCTGVLETTLCWSMINLFSIYKLANGHGRTIWVQGGDPIMDMLWNWEFCLKLFIWFIIGVPFSYICLHHYKSFYGAIT